METERDKDLQKWLDRRRIVKQCGLILLEDKESDLSKSCCEYSCSLKEQKYCKNILLPIPLKVIYVKSSLPGSASNIHKDILNALKRPSNTSNLRNLRERVFNMFKLHKVELLIVDCAHLLKREAMVELIKIYDDLNIAVVISGNYDLDKKLSRYKGYRHIHNAFLRVHKYGSLTIDKDRQSTPNRLPPDPIP